MRVLFTKRGYSPIGGSESLTYQFATRLAARGHQVTGSDPAVGMLSIARSRTGGAAVTWVQSDAAGLRLDRTFDVAIMTGHVFQVFLTDADIAAALAAIRRHLRPGGRLMFETRNPLVREWQEWTPELTLTEVAVPGVGTVEVHYAIKSVDGELVTFETMFRFGFYLIPMRSRDALKCNEMNGERG